MSANISSSKILKVSKPVAHQFSESGILISENRNHARGKNCEDAVEYFFCTEGFELSSRRLKTPFAELDLVFLKEERAYIIEVKSLGRLDFGLVRVTPKQKQRLLRARQWLEGHWNCEVALAFAYVLPEGTIFIFNDDGEELNLKNET